MRKTASENSTAVGAAKFRGAKNRTGSSFYPAHYSEFLKAHKPQGIAVQFSPKVPVESVYWFCNRFRLANSFQAISAKGYSEDSDTISGYSALFRVYLTYSAFELFMEICSLTLKPAAALCARHDSSEALERIRAVKKSAEFFSAIKKRLAPDKNPDLHTEIDNFLNDQDASPLSLARSIRHIFAHGYLTSYSGEGVTPAQVIKICNHLAEFMIKVMNAEFGKRVIGSSVHRPFVVVDDELRPDGRE